MTGPLPFPSTKEDPRKCLHPESRSQASEAGSFENRLDRGTRPFHRVTDIEPESEVLFRAIVGDGCPCFKQVCFEGTKASGE